MNIFFKNKIYRRDVIIRFVNDIGELLFNSVFTIYAANFYESELAVSLVSFINMVPFLFILYLGFLADETTNKKKYIYGIGWVQAFLYICSYFVIGHNSVLAFAFISFVNLTSDLLGQYLNGLESTFYKKIVGQEGINEASLFDSVMYRIKMLLGPALGVLLLKISNNNYEFVTLINAASFIFYAIFVRKVYKDLDEPEYAQKTNFKNKIIELKNNLIEVFRVDENTDSKKSIILLFSDSLPGTIGTAMNQIFTVSLVSNPLFNLSFENYYLYII